MSGWRDLPFLPGYDLLNLDLSGNGLQNVRIGRLYDLQPQLCGHSHRALHFPAIPGVLISSGALRLLKSLTGSKSSGAGQRDIGFFEPYPHQPYPYRPGLPEAQMSSLLPFLTVSSICTRFV